MVSTVVVSALSKLLVDVEIDFLSVLPPRPASLKGLEVAAEQTLRRDGR